MMKPSSSKTFRVAFSASSLAAAGGAAGANSNGGGGNDGGFFRQMKEMYDAYANQSKQLEEIRRATNLLEKRRDEFARLKVENEKKREQSVELLKETVEGLRVQFETLEKEKREVGKVVDAIGKGAEKKLREKLEKEEHALEQRVDEMLEKEGLFFGGGEEEEKKKKPPPR
jgi:hypothetical protein